MPSPIAHAAAGVLIARMSRWGSLSRIRLFERVPLLLPLAIGLSLLPDADAAIGIALGNLGRYHNNFAGSPAFGLLVAGAIGAASWILARPHARSLFLLTLFCYQLHILMDYFTVGRGLMMAWPLASERFAPPFPLFYGVRWSHGLISPNHLLTVASELGSLLLAWSIFRAARRRGR